MHRPAPQNGLREDSSFASLLVPVWVWAIILFAICVVPVGYVATHYERDGNLTGLILFGAKFKSQELPEVRASNPVISSEWGYDGQFYAQLALDPTLRRPDFKSFGDDPGYRSQRYIPIVLAYCLGLGRPSCILAAYALLNLLFWFALLVLLLRKVPGRSIRKLACVAGCALTSGALVSIERSLTDLPGAVFTIASALMEGAGGALLLALAILSKPSAGLLLVRYFWPPPQSEFEIGRRAFYILLATAGPVLLLFYLHHVFGNNSAGKGNFAFPFCGFLGHEITAVAALWATPFDLSWWKVSDWERRFFEVLAPLSLAAQAVYFATRRRTDSAVWWLGVSFAVLFVCLSPYALIEQISSTRNVLPMTLAFNVSLFAQPGEQTYKWYYLAGNAGLLWAWHDMLGYCLQ